MQRLKIYTSYYAMYIKVDPAWQCVAISNSVPNFIFIPKFKELAPSWSLVNGYKNKELNREQFEQKYLQQIHLYVGPEKLKEMILSLNNANVVLMCYESNPNECHRSVLAHYIRMFLPEFEVCCELNFDNTLAKLSLDL